MSNEKVYWINFETMHNFMVDVFTGVGVPKEDAKICADILIAADMSNLDLSGVDFLGADFRDLNLKGADLRESIYITQSQINSALGDVTTKLPKSINMPKHWLCK